MDGDGRTVASAGTLCVGEAVPAGYLTAPSGADCDDGNPSVWADVVAYADADGDGVGAGEAQTFCTDGTVPAGFSATGTDCAVGAPPRSITCLGAALPPGTSTYGFDEDDTDPAVQWDGFDEELIVLHL